MLRALRKADNDVPVVVMTGHFPADVVSLTHRGVRRCGSVNEAGDDYRSAERGTARRGA